MSFSIGSAALHSGVSVHTLRYYERIGLLGEVARTRAGRRVYSADDLDWILLLRCLRSSGMAITEMKAFSQLVRSGGGIADRIEILARHQKHVEASLAEFQKALGIIDEKLTRYREVSGKNAATNEPTSSLDVGK